MDSQFIGEYRVLRKLGAGGMASVYLAAHRDVPNLRTVLKELSDSQLADRFRREADKLALLDGYGGICQIKHFFEDKGRFYIVMEYIEGPNLEELIRSDSPPDLATSVELVRSILATLEFAHQRGVIHRDIKPTNVMIDRNGQVKVIDFGIAKGATDPDLTQVGSSLGSPRYMAPEQFSSDGSVDWARCDIYAVGVTLYYLLTHDFPFLAGDIFEMCEAKRTRDPTPPSRINPAISPQLDAIILKSMARNPQDRFASAAEMRAALSSVAFPAGASGDARRDVTEVLQSFTLTGRVPPTPAPAPTPAAADTPPPAAVSPSRPSAPWYRRRPAIMAGGLLLVTLVAVGGLLVLRPDGQAPQPGSQAPQPGSQAPQPGSQAPQPGSPASPPPALIAPKPEAVLLDPRVCFRWRAEAAGRPCDLELATEPAFSTPQAHPAITADSLRLETPLGVGLHFWRVRTSAPSGGPAGPWSAAGSFRVEPPVKAVATLTVTIKPKGELFVDGVSVGWVERRTLPIEAGKPHAIEVSNPQSREKRLSHTVNLQKDEKKTIPFAFTMPQATVQVRIGAVMDDHPVLNAAIAIDGRPIEDETICTTDLSVGRHEIVVRRKINGVDCEGRTTVDLTEGMSLQPIQIRMQPKR